VINPGSDAVVHQALGHGPRANDAASTDSTPLGGIDEAEGPIILRFFEILDDWEARCNGKN
jgi:hypothetical protein